jgi:hypothetical protein
MQMLWDGKMDERWIVTNFDGDVHNNFRVLSWNLPGKTEENQEKPVRIASNPASMQSEYLSNTNPMCLVYTI